MEDVKEAAAPAANETGEEATASAPAPTAAEIQATASAPAPTAAEIQAADEKAQAEGFMDAAAKKVAEDAAASKAANPARKRAPRKKASAGFEAKAVNPKGKAVLAELAAKGAAVKVTLGTENGPDTEIPVLELKLQRRRRFAVTTANANFATAAMTRARKLTHAYAFAMDDTVKDSPLGRCELGAAMLVSPGEQLQFRPGSLAFDASSDEG